jgi:hypothetical protein
VFSTTTPSCNVVFASQPIHAIFQMEISKGNNFLLDYPYISDSFFIISYLALINPTTQPFTFWSAV